MANINRLNSVYDELHRICNENHAESITIKLPHPIDMHTFTVDLKDIRSDIMRERVKAVIGQDLCETVTLIGESKKTLTYEIYA